MHVDEDLCVVRQVLQHLSNDQITRVLKRLQPFKTAIVAEHHPARLLRPNLDKHTGADTRIEFDSGVYLEYPPKPVAHRHAFDTLSEPNFSGLKCSGAGLVRRFWGRTLPHAMTGQRRDAPLKNAPNPVLPTTLRVSRRVGLRISTEIRLTE